MQATLKQCYCQQFDDLQKHEDLERHFSSLLDDFRHLKAEKERLDSVLQQSRSDLREAQSYQAQQESRLREASSELTLAEEVIDDITSSKLVGLQRFFEHYNLPAVCLTLFGKVLELQHYLRILRKHAKVERPSAGIESEVRYQIATHDQVRPWTVSIEFHYMFSLCFHWISLNFFRFQSGEVSRRSLQTYIDHLKLSIPSSMVSQVLLALLGLDAPCDAKRFGQLLTQPPAWESLDFATALWGSAGEPAAQVVHRARLRQER